MANQTGKRYVCEGCATEMLVTRGGAGVLTCCGQPMVQRSGKAAPAAAAPATTATEGQ